MRSFNVGHWCFLFAEMGTWLQGISDEKTKVVPPDILKFFIEKQLAMANLLAVYAELPESEAMIGRIRHDFVVDPKKKKWILRKKVKVSTLLSDLRHLKETMQSELEKKECLILSGKVSGYYSDPEKAEKTAFGEAVDKAFPSAHTDIVEAGNCLACGRNNAAVYHLMRVAEVGLRTLAWDRRVIAKNKRGNPIPLELTEWGQLIRDIETKVKDIQNWRAKLSREEAHQFYNRLLVEGRAFNDGWRRHVMHSRSHSFDDSEALAIWGHVMRFTQTMATRLSETQRTPNVWK